MCFKLADATICFSMDTRLDTKRGITSIGICSKPASRIHSTTTLPVAALELIKKAKTASNVLPSEISGVTSSHWALRLIKFVKQTRAFKLSSKLNCTSFDCDCKWRRACELGCEKDCQSTLVSESALVRCKSMS